MLGERERALRVDPAAPFLHSYDSTEPAGSANDSEAAADAHRAAAKAPRVATGCKRRRVEREARRARVDRAGVKRRDVAAERIEEIDASVGHRRRKRHAQHRSRAGGVRTNA